MNINYRIPDELHRRLKMVAAREGLTLKDLIIQLLDTTMIREQSTDDE